MVFYFAIFVGALVCALLFTPFFIWVAHRLQIVDAPNPNNPGKIHRQPTALLGGMTIYFTLLTIGGFALEWSFTVVGFFTALTIVLLLGLFDDIYSLDYRLRLGVQGIVAIFIVFGLDIKIEFLADIPILGDLVTLFWIVGVTNALNLMDNVDGATGGVSFVASVGLFVFGYLTGQTVVALMALALAGACLGFLHYNFKPASIFLGDAGTLLLGTTLATLSLLATKGMGTFEWHYLFIFPLLLGVPIYDTTLATMLRLYYKRPIYKADKSNLTYRLFDLGFSQVQAVLIEYGMAIYFLMSTFVLWWSPLPAHGVVVVMITGGILALLGVHFARSNSTIKTKSVPRPTEKDRAVPYTIRRHRVKQETSLVTSQTDH